MLDFYLNTERKNSHSKLRICKENRNAIIIRIKKFHYEYQQNSNVCYNSILQIYNAEYWAFSLWFLMAQYTQHNVVNREILRAFIKNCIHQTAKDLLPLSQLDDTAVIKDTMPRKFDFYYKVFSSENIIKQMRRKYREKLIRSKKWKKSSKYLINEVDFYVDIEKLLDTAGLNDFKKIFPVLETWQKENVPIKSLWGGLKILMLNVKFQKIWRKIQKEKVPA